MKKIKRFEDLEVFKRGYSISLEMHKLSLELPKLEQYALADQIRRASKSICANIAEGFSRQSVSGAEYKRFLLMSISSADEMRVWLRYCLDLGYIDKDHWQRWRDDYQVLARMLQKLYQSWN